MTIQEKEAWLNRAFELVPEQAYLKEELEELRRLRDRCTDTSVNISGSSGGSCGNATEAKLITYAAAAELYSREVEEQYRRYYAIKAEIKQAIDTLNDPAERAVLTGRFLRFHKLDDIARRLHYSLSQVKRLKRRGIEKIRLKDDTL